MKSHHDIHDEVRDCDEWTFTRDFVQAVMFHKTEWEDKHPISYAFGAKPTPTGRELCLFCGSAMSEQACEGYKSEVKRVLKDEILMEYMHATCPDCHTPIDETTQCEMIDGSDTFVWVDGQLPSEPAKTSYKTMYEPCECLFEIGEETIRWGLNKDRLQSEHWFDGCIFD